MIMVKKSHLLAQQRGGDDRTKFYNDLVWTGQSDEKFLNKGKKIIHESQTEYPLNVYITLKTL